MSNREINGGVHQVKTQRDQEAGPGVFYVELYAKRRRAVAHDRLGNPVDSDRMWPSMSCASPMMAPVKRPAMGLRRAIAKKIVTSNGKSI